MKHFTSLLAVGVVAASALLAACSRPALQTAAPGAAGPTTEQHTIPVPIRLQAVAADGRALPPGSWVNRTPVTLSISEPEGTGSGLVSEVEFREADQPFSGVPTATGQPGSTLVVAPGMTAGKTYHWQARLREPGGATGAWAASPGIIGYQPDPPPPPVIQALPQNGLVKHDSVDVAWQPAADPAGIDGYAYTVTSSPEAARPANVGTATTQATVNLPSDGTWFFHVWALDKAGNWSAAATEELHRDTQPPRISNAFYRTFAYNPGYGTLPISFDLSKAGDVSVAILPATSDQPDRTYQLGRQQGKVKLEWDGKDGRGQVVQPGSYRFRVIATDDGGNTADAVYDKLLVSQKRIVVSLNQQKLWAYDGDKVVLQTLVTTGGPLLPTPEGVFQILSKQTDFTFHSPWPKGSPYWYPDSFTNYAMMFDTDGYFIHDAPWRHTFGPGSNVVPGQPGEETSGTHGCVNMPLGTQTKLFAWADPGTPVIVQK